MGLANDMGTAWRRGPRAMRDALVATWELALASVAFRPGRIEKLPLLRHTGKFADLLTDAQRELVERVAYAVPIMGLRVPWRSDCVVQALAGRHWLARNGIASVICIGVRKDGEGLAAHAWLKVGERIVTGGDVSGYTELPAAKLPPGLIA